jgi:hypothetical protein
MMTLNEKEQATTTKKKQEKTVARRTNNKSCPILFALVSLVPRLECSIVPLPAQIKGVLFQTPNSHVHRHRVS